MKKKFLSVLFFCIATYIYVYAQISEGVLESAAIDTIPKVADFQRNQGLNGLPLEYSLKTYCPKPNNQGAAASSVFQSICYGAMTMLYAIQNNMKEQTQINQIAFSPMYAFNQVKTDCFRGISFIQAFSFLQKNGTTLFAAFEKSNANTNDCSEIPTTAHHKTAQQYKIKHFMKVFSRDDSPKARQYRIQKCLSENQPVIVGMWLPNDISTHTGVKDYQSSEDATAMAHALVVIGYDEHSFELMNSWGTNWGNKGFFKIKYENFFNYCKEAYRIDFDAKTSETKSIEANTEALQGTFEWRTPIDGSMQAVPFALQDGKYYKMTQESYFGQDFQLAVLNLQKGKYVYVFSQADDKKIYWHWPQKAFSDFNNPRLAESPLIVYDNATFLVPNAQLVFSKANAGADMIFILYSNKELDINDLMFRIKKMETDNHELTTLNKFEKAFNGLLADWKTIQYESKRPAFKAVPSGKIVPLIFKAE
jgi:Papain family cysteine protease